MFLRGFFFNLNFLRNEGHTTMSCPHRVATEYGVTPASHRNAGNSVEYVFERQLRPNMPYVSVFFLIFFLILNCHYSVYLISAWYLYVQMVVMCQIMSQGVKSLTLVSFEFVLTVYSIHCALDEYVLYLMLTYFALHFMLSCYIIVLGFVWLSSYWICCNSLQ